MLRMTGRARTTVRHRKSKSRSIHVGEELTPDRNPGSREPGVIFLLKREGCWMLAAWTGLALLAFAMSCGQSMVSGCSRSGRGVMPNVIERCQMILQLH